MKKPILLLLLSVITISIFTGFYCSGYNSILNIEAVCTGTENQICIVYELWNLTILENPEIIDKLYYNANTGYFESEKSNLYLDPNTGYLFNDFSHITTVKIN